MRRPSGRCFLLWLPRGDMAAEGRYACREVICRAVRWGGACSGAVFFVAACRGTKCCRKAKCWPRGDMPGGLFGRAVGATPGRFGCRFVRSPILRRRLFGGRFVRLPIRSGSFLSGRLAGFWVCWFSGAIFPSAFFPAASGGRFVGADLSVR